MAIDLSKENILSRMSYSGSSFQLALFRIALGAQIFYSASSDLFRLLQIVKGTTGTKTMFPTLVEVYVAAYSFPYLVIIVQTLSVLMIIGAFTRYILPLLFVTFLLLFGFWYTKFNAPVPWLYIWFPLLILCFCRCSDRLSIDSLLGFCKEEKIKTNIYRWPVEIVIGWFAYIYFAAGIAKILPFSKGLGWMDGATSQKIVHDRYLDSVFHFVFQRPFFDYTQHSWLFAGLSIFSLLIELFCIVLLFTNRYNYAIIFLVFSMHMFLYLTGVPAFVQLALVLSICLLPGEIFTESIKAQKVR